MPMGAISWANARFGSARASALVGEGSLRCRAVPCSALQCLAVDGGWGLLASVESGLCIHKPPSKKIPNS